MTKVKQYKLEWNASDVLAQGMVLSGYLTSFLIKLVSVYQSE